MGRWSREISRYAALFDSLSDAYDQSGVPFFGQIARGLVDGLELVPGERVLDLGAGRGAATFPLAAAVGEQGRVDTVDLAPGMVRRLTEDARGVRQVHVGLGDAADPRPPAPPYDAVVSSLVIFFLDDPVGALTRWHALLRTGGRVGVATFQPWHGAWRALDELEDEFSESPTSPDPRFDTDEGVAGTVAVGRLLGGAHRAGELRRGVRRRRPVAGVVMGDPDGRPVEADPRGRASRDHGARDRDPRTQPPPGRSSGPGGRRPLHLRHRLIR